MKKVIYALHGFLGQASDWQQVQKKMREEKPDWEFVPLDLFRMSEFLPIQGFDQWTQKFYEWMSDYETLHFPEQMPEQKCERTLVGYSLGGRLALHLLQAKPDLWSGAVFISTNPGIKEEAEKLQRLEADQRWAAKFLQQNFQDTLLEWNSQAVLRGSYEPERFEINYDMADLAAALVNWSLALQKDFRLLMDLWEVRQIWIAGEKDQKFSEMLKSLPESPDIQRWVVEGASHRLIFEAPEEVAHFIVRVSSPLPIV